MADVAVVLCMARKLFVDILDDCGKSATPACTAVCDASIIAAPW